MGHETFYATYYGMATPGSCFQTILISIKEILSQTPPPAAAASGGVEIVRILVDAGTDVNKPGWMGQTPLALAVEKGNAQILGILLGIEPVEPAPVGDAGTETVGFASVSAGWTHTCGLRTDGSVECWGHDDEYGRTKPSPGQFASTSAGSAHTCGLRRDGLVECWGSDEHGQATAA